MLNYVVYSFFFLLIKQKGVFPKLIGKILVAFNNTIGKI
jgi:hypothetical protein